MRKKIKIIFAAQAAGGFNALLPVIQEAKRQKNFSLKILLAGPSCQLAQAQKLNYQNRQSLAKKALFSFLKREKPDLILAATSGGLSLEKRIIAAARSQGVKTLALMDFWSNYRQRFQNGQKNHLSLPDYILVTDKIMQEEMVGAGFPEAKLIIVGNPAFDFFPSAARQKPNEGFITFFCQPFSELSGRGRGTDWGFDEIQVFEDLVKALEEIPARMPLRVKFHPLAKKFNKFDRIINKTKLAVFFEKKLSTDKLLQKSSLVVGMNSMALFRAVLMGKNVLSYQPGLKRADPLISNRLGLSAAVYQKRALYPALKRMLDGSWAPGNIKLIGEYTRNKSTQKVINFIKRLR